MEIPQQPIQPIVDCIADEHYCGVDEDFVDNSIDDQGHYKFDDLPGKIAVFVTNFYGVEIKMAYDLSNYEASDIAYFTELIGGPERSELTVHQGNNHTSSIVYNNGKIIFNFTGMDSSYTSFNITVPAANVVDALRRLI